MEISSVRDTMHETFLLLSTHQCSQKSCSGERFFLFLKNLLACGLSQTLYLWKYTIALATLSLQLAF